MADEIRPIDPPDMIKELADMIGGTIQECALLPDGSGFATMSFPLRKDHWIYKKGADGFSLPPPMVFRVGAGDSIQLPPMTRQELADHIRLAGRYAVRASTMNGAVTDFDPDAMLQNLIVGFLGYWTSDGLSSDEWANPSPETLESLHENRDLGTSSSLQQTNFEPDQNV